MQDPSSLIDTTIRFSQYRDTSTNTKLGTYQYDNNVNHNHSTTILVSQDPFQASNLLTRGTDFGASSTFNSSFSGSPQSNPKNVAINYFIKY
jgi:hypothetical protein